MKKTWVDDEIKYLINNYSDSGNERCAKTLNRPIKSISCKANRLGLKLNKNILHQIRKKSHIEKDNFNLELLNKMNPDFAYILGFIWADGFVDKKTNNIKIGCVIEDINEIENIFFRCGTWLQYVTKEKHWRIRKTLSITNRKLHSFLVDNDYLLKSKISPIKIINKIPEQLHSYFLLGLIDGDGCFYFNERLKLRQFSIAGTYKQDWNGVEFLFKKINIVSYHIQQRKTNNSSSSEIRITNKSDIFILGEYIYKNNNYGLNRKKQKYCKIIN